MTNDTELGRTCNALVDSHAQLFREAIQRQPLPFPRVIAYLADSECPVAQDDLKALRRRFCVQRLPAPQARYVPLLLSAEGCDPLRRFRRAVRRPVANQIPPGPWAWEAYLLVIGTLGVTASIVLATERSLCFEAN